MKSHLLASMESSDHAPDYDRATISLAGPEDIQRWSSGEVKNPKTVNFRSCLPEKEGLFCERIFGPARDWACSCGKYAGMKYKGFICDRCGVQIRNSNVRRKRMGHIELAAPVVHIWFFRAEPSRLGTLLNMEAASLEKIIYYQNYVVTEPGATALKKQQTLAEQEYRDARHQYGSAAFRAGMGAEAIREILSGLDLVKLACELRKHLVESDRTQQTQRLVNRLELVESIRDSRNRPEWMVLDVIPVVPPLFRPLVLFDSGDLDPSDLNSLYMLIIKRNNSLRKLLDLKAPETIIRNWKRSLQQAVDGLFDNTRRKRPLVNSKNEPLKSLTGMVRDWLKRSGENLLSKNVNYSAQSVVAVDPTLKLHQCGLPKRIALELLQPFIIRRLKELRQADTLRTAKKMLERQDAEVRDALEKVIENHPVLLSHTVTLDRTGVQAFAPVLVDGNAIKLHPLAYKSFNADFDGDLTAVHLPLSIEAQVEAQTLLMSTNNILSPANGVPIASSSQDLVLGCYYMTMAVPGCKGHGMTFSSTEEVELAYSVGVVDINAMIRLRLPPGWQMKGQTETCAGTIIDTTVGRAIFNGVLSTGKLYYNQPMRSSELAELICDCDERLGRQQTIDLLNKMSKLVFRQVTRSGLSLTTDEMIIPPNRHEIISKAELKVTREVELLQGGIATEGESCSHVLKVRPLAHEQTATEMVHKPETNQWTRDGGAPILLMACSDPESSAELVDRVTGAQGQMVGPSGTILKTPTIANFREGLGVLDYFGSARGVRRRLSSVALDKAKIGYLARKLIDVGQNVVVTCDDCGTLRGITKSVVRRGKKAEVSLANAIRGRVSQTKIVKPITGEVIVRENEFITAEIAHTIEEVGLQKIRVRSPMTCDADRGVCSLCYGADLSTGAMVEVGMAVGVVAAQAIALGCRQGISRAQYLSGLSQWVKILEACRPAIRACIAEIDGIVRLVKADRRGIRKIIVRSETGLEWTHSVSRDRRLRVHTGDFVRAGQKLTDGLRNPYDIVRVCGEEAAQQYLLHKIQNVYRNHRVEINDKHVEIIVAQMVRNVRVDSAGDTDLLEGCVMDKVEFRARNHEWAQFVKVTDPGDSQFRTGGIVSREVLEEQNRQLKAEGRTPSQYTHLEPAKASPQLVGITQAALLSGNGFLASATSRNPVGALTEAALGGKVDWLVGLKENAILGRRIPAGTGFHTYQNSEVRFRPTALSKFAAPRPIFPLLDVADEQETAEQQAAAETSSTLESLFDAVEATATGGLAG